MCKYVSPLICFTINVPFFLIFLFINFLLHCFIFSFLNAFLPHYVNKGESK